MWGPGRRCTVPAVMPTDSSEIRPSKRPRTGDEGQAMVEAAIVLPAMVFLLLTTIQLTMVQHARIMTEYAAYCAARAGIVFNGDPTAMQQAAEIALSPTIGRTDTLLNMTRTNLSLQTLERAQRAPFRLPVARIQVLSPRSGDILTFGRHLGGRELDFDDLRTGASRANLLSINVRYYYRMMIPFANQILLNIFFAQRLNTLHLWEGVDLSRPEMFGMNALQITQPAGVASGVQDAAGIVAAAMLDRFYFPVSATYTMRMQSNFFLEYAQ